ncbi:MAG TPA: C25 family cysteine peptidase [Candidatus Thermoplasmatota archaeon]|nr:C25 family cysteine peptidase [Candidatus Thermoplasmatota archaeon]
MKRIIAISILGLLMVGECGAAAFEPEEPLEKTMIAKNNTMSVHFSSKPIILEREESVKIEIDGMTSQLMEPNKPVLPLFTKTYVLPFGSKNIKVTCAPKDIGTTTLTKKVMSARIAPLSKTNEITTYERNKTVYDSAVFYPNKWYRSDIGAGHDENDNQVIFVKVICYPVRYSPAINQVEYASTFDVVLTYEAPVQTTQNNETYGMVIIAPKSFKSKLQPLIDFKNSKGMRTTFKAVEDILDQYTGADPPEQVKYFIKDAYDTWGVTYALLVGGLKSHIFAKDKDTRSAGWKAWWVPVRYVSIPQLDDEGCLSDLYYGCLYNGTGGFDSWDSNGDGVYAAWDAPGAARDTFDMYPEVYVGRLPVTNKREVANVVKKIITYESTGPDEKPWYKSFIGIGGKTFDYYEGKPDGEYLCDLSFNYTKNAIPDLNLVTVYSTNKNTSGFVPVAKDIQTAISHGAGYVDFQGHGNPLIWDTIWFDGEYPNGWCGGITLYNFLKLSNREKLPVVVVGGCHNGMYNVSLLKTLRDKTGANYFCYGIPIPVCFSWGLVVKYPGGAIASTGCTGYGMGYQGNPVSLSGKLESNFFYEIGNGSTNLGQAHSGAIQKFLQEEEINQVEAFVITNWALFGDPSLRLGGYP